MPSSPCLSRTRARPLARAACACSLHVSLPVHLWCIARTVAPPHRHAQKGVSFKTAEVLALVDAVMDGKVHKDYVVVGGQQCVPLNSSRAPKLMLSCCPGAHRYDHDCHGDIILWEGHVQHQSRWCHNRTDGKAAHSRNLLRPRQCCRGNSASPPVHR